MRAVTRAQHDATQQRLSYALETTQQRTTLAACPFRSSIGRTFPDSFPSFPHGRLSPKKTTNRGESIVRQNSRWIEGRVHSRRGLMYMLWVTIFGCMPMSLVTQAKAGVLDQITTFHIPAERMTQALLDLGRQAHIQVILRETTPQGARSVGLVGRYTLRQAIETVLRESNLAYAASDHTLEVFPKTVRRTELLPQSVSNESFASADQRTSPRKTEAPKKSKKSPKPSKAPPPELGEVIVTGTHIRGGPPPSAPIITITERQIRESGYQTMEQVMDALPENFASVGSGQTVDISSQNDSGNFASGVAVNLNGLGFDSTLVLVNGHRIAPGGGDGAFTDVSVIPLSAVARIDVMTNGASAIYGSDAVGGVVNYVLKSHLNGASTSLEYGSVTHGGLKDTEATQSFGTSWTGGNLFLSYDYHKRTELAAADRAYANMAGPYALLPTSYQNNVYLTASQRLNTRTRIEADGFFANRNSTSQFVESLVPIQERTTVGQYGAAFEIHRVIGLHWRAHVRVGAGENRSRGIDTYGSVVTHSGLLSASIGANGPVAQMPAGHLKAAMGAQYRRETFKTAFTGEFVSEGALDRSRSVDALYLEAAVPLWAASSSAAGRSRANLDLAARYERYTDFGSTVNPMAGLALKPMKQLKLRATISSSFRAPNFEELYGQQYLLLFNAPDPRLGGTQEPVLVRSGANPNLKPEKSVEWTAGLDFDGGAIHLPFSITYFDIHFQDRIGSPNIPFNLSLENQSIYGQFTQWNPTASQLQVLLSQYPQFYNETIYPGLGPQQSALSAVAVSNNSLQNLGITNVNGIDLNAKYRVQFGAWHYHAAAQVSYLTKYSNKFAPGAASQNLLSTYENPVNLRGRMTSGVAIGPWSGNVAINYTNHYMNDTSQIPEEIASWTTIDAQIAYRFKFATRPLRNLDVSLSCTNCANRAPPYVSSPTYLFNFDPLNASPLGRFVSLTMRASW